MIPANELRIGNWVLDFNNAYCPVSFVTFSNYEIAVQTDIRPIPLTAEILKKCGFTIDGTVANSFYLSPLYLMAEAEGWHMRINNAYVNRNPIASLHHLQNFYYDLTGKELEFDPD